MDELITNLGPNPGKLSFPVIKEALETSLHCSDLTGYRESIRKYFFKALMSNTDTKDTTTTAATTTTTTTTTTTIASTTTTNYEEQLDSIFIELKEDIGNGYSIFQIKHALRKGMDNLDSIFPGRKKMIDQYVTSKKDEIEHIRESHKLWGNEVLTPTPTTTTTTTTTDLPPSNCIEKLDSIFITLKKDIENGYGNYQIKSAIEYGMDNLGIQFTGRSKYIDQYMTTKKKK